MQPLTLSDIVFSILNEYCDVVVEWKDNKDNKSLRKVKSADIFNKNLKIFYFILQFPAIQTRYFQPFKTNARKL